MNTELQGEKWTRRARKCKNWCIGLRWRLSRGLFAVPIPLLTPYLGFKVCDVLIALPFIATLFGFSTRSALQGDVPGSGWPPTVGLLLTFFFVVRRNSLLLSITGISFERGLFYHKISAVSTTLLAGLHGWSHYRASNTSEQGNKQAKVVTGLVSFGGMVLLLVLSLNSIRRRFFDFFVRAHWILFIIVIVYAVAHGATLALFGIVPWMIDVVYRIVFQVRMYSHGSSDSSQGNFKQLPRGVTSQGQVTMVRLGDNMLRIQFRRERVDTEEIFEYKAGQYVFVCVPEISLLEWHPFSISSSPAEATVTLHVKVVGDWTQRLRKLTHDAEIGERVPVNLLAEGPYGGVSVDIYRPQTYSHFVLLSEGIGVFPLRSVVTWLHHEQASRNRESIDRVHLVWSVYTHTELKTLLAVENLSENDPDNFFVAANPHQKPSFHNEIADVFTFDFHVAERNPDTDCPVEADNFVHFGSQPNYVQILQDIGTDCKRNSVHRVAVLLCTSSHTSTDIVSTCITLSKTLQVSFDVHIENFDF
ncbi:hypothetical protein PHYSODRAFT_526416 [Phytophthora sojae]|uniref:FAD-binding FR-type domain-containing protein n=1 Tax=Phytophthora sojae (strain P6497) TaxID=1094619 RepID=G5A8S7_PHYSP|nr:hypothetical protein PHYSODRAFT_526416 [Phytophthora sojae]EGZ08303.1 hypothetical protein PHYSODRAFT_526416 [Phytophthora sojae]|eukprot:XP_009536475.1 hypothetical protein PHYSODRAFT_526416 [Phytophthora sojae]